VWTLELRFTRVLDGVEDVASASSAISIGRVSAPLADIRGFLEAAVLANADALKTFISKECVR